MINPPVWFFVMLNHPYWAPAPLQNTRAHLAADSVVVCSVLLYKIITLSMETLFKTVKENSTPIEATVTGQSIM